MSDWNWASALRKEGVDWEQYSRTGRERERSLRERKRQREFDCLMLCHEIHRIRKQEEDEEEEEEEERQRHKHMPFSLRP